MYTVNYFVVGETSQDFNYKNNYSPLNGIFITLTDINSKDIVHTRPNKKTSLYFFIVTITFIYSDVLYQKTKFQQVSVETI